MARKARRQPTRPRGEGFSQQERRPRRRPPVMLDFGGATAEEIAQAIFAVDKRPPTKKPRRRPRP